MIFPGNVAGRISRPRDCVFAVGIPTSQVEFEEKQEIDDTFAARFNTYARYEKTIAEPLRYAGQMLTKIGVRVIQGLSLPVFSALFGDERVHVIVLFSHWLDETVESEGAIEFAEGMVGTARILAAVPEHAAGVFDLCVCHPIDLVGRLRSERSRLLLHFRKLSVHPSVCLSFYKALFCQLARKPNSYLHVFAALQSSLRRRIDGRRD